MLKLILTFTTSCLIFFHNGNSQTRNIQPQLYSLKLSSTTYVIKAHYSSGYKSRAQQLQSMLEDAINFYTATFKVSPKIDLAVLTKKDFDKIYSELTITPPYGIPFVSDSPHVVVLPAELNGVVTTRALEIEPLVSASTREELKKAGFTYKQAAYKIVDLIGFHELGHVYEDVLGIYSNQRFLRELLASYFSYTFLRKNYPRQAELWHLVHEINVYTYENPKHTSISDLERLSVGVGADNYGWYQGQLQKRVKEVYDKKGVSFLFETKKEFPIEKKQDYTVSETLQKLEKICPGFLSWSKNFSDQ